MISKYEQRTNRTKNMRGDLSKQRHKSQGYRPAAEPRPKYGEPHPVCVAASEGLPQKYGRIINIASMYGLVGNKIAGSSPYHAAKGGVVNLTRALAAEWGKYGITVNAICPGYFYTPLTKETLDTPSFKAYADSVIPAERYGEEGELDTAAIFLASDKTAYVNGVMLPVDGGYTCV